MSRAEATARVRRECARAGLARHVERCRHEHGLTQAQCAATLGFSASRWGYLEDPDHKAALSVADVEALGEVYPDLARDLMTRVVESLGLRIVPADQACDRLDDVRALGELTAELGAILAAEAEAQRDQLYDRGESVSLRDLYTALAQRAIERAARFEEPAKSGIDAVRTPLTAVPGGAR